MQTQYMQQGYYPYAYAASAQQAGAMRKCFFFLLVHYEMIKSCYILLSSRRLQNGPAKCSLGSPRNSCTRSHSSSHSSKWFSRPSNDVQCCHAPISNPMKLLNYSMFVLYKICWSQNKVIKSVVLFLVLSGQEQMCISTN